MRSIVDRASTLESNAGRGNNDTTVSDADSDYDSGGIPAPPSNLACRLDVTSALGNM